ncbi:MAG TPA: S-adenosyl-l-methionine hydroxide adenosyltransferase family protein [Panacibacter sp.]|nr:S-adenosyl-l-methionine hydroxide adenosyltransferase family protein [Panacibacter sp.]HNP45200.1 S-adenosyl-l-methionine hydroxide adenosyltransferase family protein [Panacibacter sp.]
MKRVKRLLIIFAFINWGVAVCAQSNLLIFQTDFGLKDGAVSAMKGVAMGVSANLKVFDLTHEIPAYNIWEAGYRLYQTAQYWPTGSVFVSVVDPGVGSARKSVVLKTKSGHYFVGPDNGQLTLVAESLGIAEVREIDETKNRLKNSNESYTFHGRDVYAYTGARLAAGAISFDEVGPSLPAQVIKIEYQKAVLENDIIKGNIPILDIQYGNIWTNIDKSSFAKLGLKYGDKLHVIIFNEAKKVYEGIMPYATTFSAVPQGKPLCYVNSLLNVSFALNQQNFSQQNKVFSGPEWTVQIKKQ